MKSQTTIWDMIVPRANVKDHALDRTVKPAYMLVDDGEGLRCVRHCCFRTLRDKRCGYSFGS
jgi:hypothetical protein